VAELPTTSPRFVRRSSDVVVAAVGLVVLAIGMLLVQDETVSGFEESAFRAINDLPQALYPVLWPFQQLGALLVGPVVAVGALIARKYRLAAAVLVATLLKLVTERVVKALVSRERPGSSIGADIELRGDVSATGESFVSGHAVLVAALAALVAPYLPGRWKVLPWVIVGLVMLTRVYVGAHNPLDVICGAGLGVAIGSCLNLVFGVPSPDRLATS
jgi:undecaprenyl-diphosphatase